LINFISNLPADLRSGGFSAMNAAAMEALSKRHSIHYAGPISPPVELWRKGVSKLLRAVGGGGDFYFFSRTRLAAVAASVVERCHPEARLDFFHGFTPWIGYRSDRPFVAWGDCTFRDYVEIYHNPASFRPDDLARIQRDEALWMRRAVCLAFTSSWAAERARRDYDLDPAKIVVVGVFGEAEPPKADAYGGGKCFAFVSTNFRAKGGAVVLEAFERLRLRHAEAELIVVGDAPDKAARQPGVSTTGFLRKENPVENARLRAILGRVRAVVHPTRSDVSPLLAVEAGYFGCPIISTRRFAIPEIVADLETGLLLDDPSDPQAVANAMAWMLEAGEAYTAMRQAAWDRTRRELTKERFEVRLLDCVQAALAEVEP
jgi:glycosyltransferase involved in cell wall biosynthesis